MAKHEHKVVKLDDMSSFNLTRVVNRLADEDGGGWKLVAVSPISTTTDGAHSSVAAFFRRKVRQP